jgi:hypothetical protein
VIRNGLDNKSDIGKGINDEQSLVLKMVLACSLITEGGGQSEIGYRLFESVRAAADRALHSEVIEIKRLPLLALVVCKSLSDARNKTFIAETSAYETHL